MLRARGLRWTRAFRAVIYVVNARGSKAEIYVKKPECPARKSRPSLKGESTPKGRGDKWAKGPFL
jgi:hypothetical protein